MIKEITNTQLVPSDYRGRIESRLSLYSRRNKCAKCFLPASFRSIEFNEEGVCNYCRDYQVLSDLTGTPQRHQEFIKILERAHRKVGTLYDCIVCLSGGKDSAYLLDLFKEEYDLSIIGVTVDTGFLSDIAKQNIRKTISELEVDHVFLRAPSEILDIYRYGFTHPSGLGVEYDVCDLCDGIIRREIVQFAVDNNIPLIADAFDPFQLIDARLHKLDLNIGDPLSCWPKGIKRNGLFRELYELRNFGSKTAPFELYPFLYLPYDAELIWQTMEEKDILVNPDPNVTNCRLTYLLDFVDLMRKGVPAYLHNISSHLRQGGISLQEAEQWIEEAFMEYADGVYDKQVLDALRALDIELEALILDKGVVHSNCG
jgi:hypothetical protein